jgi:hypothetical protein
VVPPLGDGHAPIPAARRDHGSQPPSGCAIRRQLDGGDAAEPVRRRGWADWREVEWFTFGLVRARQALDGVELRLFGRWPLLLAFGRPVVAVAGGHRCCYPITGGMLAREPAGQIVFAQERAGDPAAFALDHRGLLATRPGEPDWTGALYSQVQRRLHLAISRR